MGVKLKFNPSKKCKGIKSKADLTLSDLESFKVSSLTKRQVFSLCNGVYDPLGIASPYTIKLKLLIRDCLLSQDRVDLSSKKAWDLAIPENYVKQWALLVKEGITQDILAFNRRVRPASAVRAPSLVGFLIGLLLQWLGQCILGGCVLKIKVR